jgi:hypothetical protein
MSILGSLDTIAVRAKTMAGLKECYAVTGAGISDDLRPMPRGIDDGPVGLVWLGSADMASSVAEHLVVDVTLDLWAQADDGGYAYKTLSAFPDLARGVFRQGMTLDGESTRCQLVGWDGIQTETAGDRAYLVLPLRLQVLLVRYGAASAAAAGPSFGQAFNGDFA